MPTGTQRCDRVNHTSTQEPVKCDGNFNQSSLPWCLWCWFLSHTYSLSLFTSLIICCQQCSLWTPAGNTDNQLRSDWTWDCFVKVLNVATVLHTLTQTEKFPHLVFFFFFYLESYEGIKTYWMSIFRHHLSVFVSLLCLLGLWRMVTRTEPGSSFARGFFLKGSFSLSKCRFGSFLLLQGPVMV